MRACVCVSVRVCACVFGCYAACFGEGQQRHTHTHTHTHTNTHTNTRIHTHTLGPARCGGPGPRAVCSEPSAGPQAGTNATRTRRSGRHDTPPGAQVAASPHVTDRSRHSHLEARHVVVLSTGTGDNQPHEGRPRPTHRAAASPPRPPPSTPPHAQPNALCSGQTHA